MKPPTASLALPNSSAMLRVGVSFLKETKGLAAFGALTQTGGEPSITALFVRNQGGPGGVAGLKGGTIKRGLFGKNAVAQSVGTKEEQLFHKDCVWFALQLGAT